jgi:hypothetical protein
VEQSPAPILPPPRPGLALLLDIFIAPARAYTTLAQTAQWWPAALVVLACLVASNLLTLPAEMNVAKIKLSGLELALLMALQLLPLLVAWGFIASIFVSLSPNEPRRYWPFFALAVAGSLPEGLGAMLSALAVRLHDPAGFHSLAQIVNALPTTLAIFSQRGDKPEVAFLSSFGLFNVWKLLFIAFGARAIGGIRLVLALIVAFSIDFAFALTSALSLR